MIDHDIETFEDELYKKSKETAFMYRFIVRNEIYNKSKKLITHKPNMKIDKVLDIDNVYRYSISNFWTERINPLNENSDEYKWELDYYFLNEEKLNGR